MDLSVVDESPAHHHTQSTAVHANVSVTERSICGTTCVSYIPGTELHIQGNFAYLNGWINKSCWKGEAGRLV